MILSHDQYGQVYLIHQGDAIIGYLVVTFGFSLEFHGRNAFVDELYIREAYRGQGIGTQSLQWAEQICRDQGIQALHLEVDRRNIQAQSLYRTVGFVDHDRYLLTKALIPKSGSDHSQHLTPPSLKLINSLLKGTCISSSC